MRTSIGALVAVVALLSGSQTPAAAGHDWQLPHCSGGEAAGTRCVWDATHMGNGEGRSFRVNRAGEVKRISHARAHALAYGVDR